MTDIDDAKDRVRAILAGISDLENELEEELHRREDAVLYQISNRKVRFESDIRAAHRRVRLAFTTWVRESQPRNVLSAPVIYAMVVPIAFLDISLSIYQALCFPLYRISPVRRSRFVVIDRHRLAYLNLIEKLNCVYCGYASGVLAYAREIAARTEQYWCPIKHARRAVGTHARYAEFVDYGDPEAFQQTQTRLREALAHDDCSRTDDPSKNTESMK